MAKALLAVRAEVPEAERARFDHWYETDHLPWALRAFEARRAWRCWSRSDPAVHVAFYEFDSVEAAKAASWRPFCWDRAFLTPPAARPISRLMTTPLAALSLRRRRATTARARFRV